MVIIVFHLTYIRLASSWKVSGLTYEYVLHRFRVNEHHKSHMEIDVDAVSQRISGS